MNEFMIWKLTQGFVWRMDSRKPGAKEGRLFSSLVQKYRQDVSIDGYLDMGNSKKDEEAVGLGTYFAVKASKT